MIRWYDWFIAVVAADLILSSFLIGLSTSTFWEPFVYGALVGLFIRLWTDGYCQARLRMENNRGQ